MRVGAIEPVGITKASASNVRNRNANTKATMIDSTVSRIEAAETSCAKTFRFRGGVFLGGRLGRAARRLTRLGFGGSMFVHISANIPDSIGVGNLKIV